jgi:MFS family permease
VQNCDGCCCEWARRLLVSVSCSFVCLLCQNNAICYTVGSVHRVSRRYYYGGDGSLDNEESVYDLATLVTCYFLTYCIFSFPTSWFIERYGLKAGVLFGAWLQVVGCLVRVFATPSLDVSAEDLAAPPSEHRYDEQPHGNLWLLLVGQTIASLGQAFFVNPPPLLAAMWFGVNERTLATTIACNANTLGIAAAYMLGPAMVDSVDDLPLYMEACFIAGLMTAVMATIYFPSAPPTPPSHSQLEPATVPPIESAEGCEQDHSDEPYRLSVPAASSTASPEEGSPDTAGSSAAAGSSSSASAPGPSSSESDDPEDEVLAAADPAAYEDEADRGRGRNGRGLRGLLSHSHSEHDHSN